MIEEVKGYGIMPYHKLENETPMESRPYVKDDEDAIHYLGVIIEEKIRRDPDYWYVGDFITKRIKALYHSDGRFYYINKDNKREYLSSHESHLLRMYANKGNLYLKIK